MINFEQHTTPYKPRLHQPAEVHAYLYMIIEKLHARTPDVSIVKPSLIDRAVFLQDLEDENKLYALLVIEKRNLAILIRAGAFHLDPAHPGRIALNNFRGWLNEHGITQRELCFTEPGAYERIIVQSLVRHDDISRRENPRINGLFSGWNICN